MSKQGKRKITVDSKAPETAVRPSVFERLGTKKAAVKKAAGEREHCRQWAAHGVCAYGKACKFAVTHTLVSPSKRAASKDDSSVARLHSTVVRADELDSWDQSELEYADTDMLEKRRQQLQRELEREAGKTERNVKKKKPSTSSSCSRSSSSSSASSSSSGSSSSSSSGRDKKKGKKVLKRNSSSSSDNSPSKKKKLCKDTARKCEKKTATKKDDKPTKKVVTSNPKKKNVLLKMTLTKKAISPTKKSSSTPPISAKTVSKTNTRKPSKSPAPRRDKRSASPTSTKDKDRDRQREKEKDRDKDRDRGRRSRSRKARSRSPKRSPKRKASAERARVASPKKSRRDPTPDKHRKSPTRDRDRRDNERSLDRRKDDNRRKDEDREKLAARQRERDRGGGKDTKKDSGKRGGGGGRDRRETDRREPERRETNRGLAKPSKPMERLLPRPEERLAALAAISSKTADPDKSSIASKAQEDRARKSEHVDSRRDRSSKRDRTSDREHTDYTRSMDRGIERGYEHGHSLERPYERGERYTELPLDGGERSYRSTDRYDPAYDLAAHPRYPDEEERGYGDHCDIAGFDERRRRDRSWEGSTERERPTYHPHKEWEGDDFRGPEWGRDRHWQNRDQQMVEFPDAEREPGWHHRAHPPQGPPHRGRMLDEGYVRNRPEHRDNKRRPEAESIRAKPESHPEEPVAAETEPIPDDLSEISDDPDDILNRDDMVERSDLGSPVERATSEEQVNRNDGRGGVLSNHAQEATTSPRPEGLSKEDDDSKELDFEEISDGELEEERTKATLGSALGVDWASLVAEVSRNQATTMSTGAQRRWRPERVLARLGISVAMAGAELAAEVAETIDKNEEVAENEKLPAHPVASIQVAMERRRRQRAALFGSGCDVTRALSARRDLALRRHLCLLPPTERGPARQRPTQLFHAASSLLMQSG